jgi:hypothetical protein
MRLSSVFRLLLAALALSWLVMAPAPAQQLAKRLILKDGSYQLATQWEVKGDRVRYFSAERDEWEEVPNSMVDWPATAKYEKEREAGAPPPEAVELDKELAAERQAEEARSPQVAPGLRVPSDGGILLLDTYQNQPQLVELQQSGGEINRNVKHNILRAAIIPMASAKQSIELPGLHAAIQAHSDLPSIYVNVNEPTHGAIALSQQPEQPWDRFHIVRMQAKNGKRIVGDIKINPLGKASQEQNLVPTTADQLTGGWVKVTPNQPLAPGEYAVVELLGKEGMNLYVWDFGVNPSAPPNALVIKPEASADAPSSQPPPLQKRQ